MFVKRIFEILSTDNVLTFSKNMLNFLFSRVGGAESRKCPSSFCGHCPSPEGPPAT